MAHIKRQTKHSQRDAANETLPTRHCPQDIDQRGSLASKLIPLLRVRTLAQVAKLGHIRVKTTGKLRTPAGGTSLVALGSAGARRYLASPHRQRRTCLAALRRPPRNRLAYRQRRCGRINRLQISAQRRCRGGAARVVLLQEQIERQAETALGEAASRAVAGGAAVGEQPRAGFTSIEVFRPCATDNEQQQRRRSQPRRRSGSGRSPSSRATLRRHRRADSPLPACPARRDRPAPDRRAAARSAAARCHGHASASAPAAR